MTKVITTGRSDIAGLFIKSGLFDNSKLVHTPFLVFKPRNTNIDEEGVIEVHLVFTSSELLNLPDSTEVMAQWPGKWRSDWFHFKVEDYRAYVNGLVSDDIF